MSDVQGLTEDELRQEREFLLRSLSDLDAELAAGDIDHHDYIALKDGYTARAAAVLRALDGTPPVEAAALPAAASPAAASPAAASPPSSRTVTRGRAPRWRAPLVATVVAAFAIGAGLLVAHRSGQRLPGQTVTGSISGSAAQQLSDALTDLNNGKYLDALKVYDQVIKDDPRNAEALAYRGWILRITGKAGNDPSLIDRGLQSIRDAEAAEPTYPDAHFFAGEILLRDKGDAAGAVTEFRLVLSNDPPASIVPEVQGELNAALAAAGTPASGVSPSSTAPASSPTGR